MKTAVSGSAPTSTDPHHAIDHSYNEVTLTGSDLSVRQTVPAATIPFLTTTLVVFSTSEEPQVRKVRSS